MNKYMLLLICFVSIHILAMENENAGISNKVVSTQELIKSFTKDFNANSVYKLMVYDEVHHEREKMPQKYDQALQTMANQFVNHIFMHEKEHLTLVVTLSELTKEYKNRLSRFCRLFGKYVKDVWSNQQCVLEIIDRDRYNNPNNNAKELLEKEIAEHVAILHSGFCKEAMQSAKNIPSLAPLARILDAHINKFVELLNSISPYNTKLLVAVSRNAPSNIE